MIICAVSFNCEKLNLQVEPYLPSLALFDTRQGRKLTENFYFDVNHPQVRNMVPFLNLCNCTSDRRSSLGTEFQQIQRDWLQYPKQVNIT